MPEPPAAILADRDPLTSIDAAAPVPAAAALCRSSNCDPTFHRHLHERERPTLRAAAVGKTTAIDRTSASGHAVIRTESLLMRQWQFPRGDRLAPRRIRLTPRDRENLVASRAARLRDAGLRERVPIPAVRAHQVPVAPPASQRRRRERGAHDSPRGGWRQPDLEDRARHLHQAPAHAHVRLSRGEGVGTIPRAEPEPAFRRRRQPDPVNSSHFTPVSLTLHPRRRLVKPSCPPARK